MFEDSTFESSNRIKKRNPWVVATFTINIGILAALIIYPLINYEALPKAALTTLLVAPPPPPPPPPPPAPEVHQQIVKPTVVSNPMLAPTKIPKEIKMVTEKEQPPQPASFGVAGMEGSGTGSAGGVIGGLFGSSTPAPVVKVATPKKVAISSGVATGLLLQQVRPIYPQIAKAARQSGTVVLQATISKTGTIENLKVVSGNAMLQSAALDAVRQWRYKPYMLNGEPVEVDTTVNVVFNLGG
jgi:protein TonB